MHWTNDAPLPEDPPELPPPETGGMEEGNPLPLEREAEGPGKPPPLPAEPVTAEVGRVPEAEELATEAKPT